MFRAAFLLYGVNIMQRRQLKYYIKLYNDLAGIRQYSLDHHGQDNP
jgi:hypothetical protein